MSKVKKNKNDIWYKIMTIVIVAIVALGAVMMIVDTTGIDDYASLHMNTAMESENFSINNAEMTYLVYTLYNNYYSQYSSYAQYLGMDPSKPLTQQMYDDKTSWRDHLIEETEKTMTQCFILCESAKAAGVELDEDDKADIQKEIESIKEYAKENNMSTKKLFRNLYGTKGMRMSDIEHVLELQALARKYSDQIIESYTYTDDDYNKKYDENTKDYQYVDYYEYTVKADYEKDASDEEKVEANEAAEKAANALKDAIAGGKSFAQAVYEYELTLEKDKEETSDDASEKEEEKTEEELVAELEESTLQTGKQYSDDELGKWLFAETAPAVGEMKVVSGDDAYTVYKVVKTPYRNEYMSANLYYLSISYSDFKTSEETKEGEADPAIAEMEAAIAEIKKAAEGVTSVEEFLKIAETFEADYQIEASEILKNIVKGTDIENFDDWAFSDKETRKVGDMQTFVEDTGAFLFYYAGTGLDAWKVAVDSDLRNAEYDEFYEAEEEKYAVTVNEKSMDKVAA